MSSPAEDALGDVSPRVIQFVFDLVAQTFVFGLYTLLLCLAIRMLLRAGLKVRPNGVKLFLILFMCLLSAGYWTYTVVYAAHLLRAHLNVATLSLSDHDGITQWLPLANAIAMLNFALTDGVIIWIAWALCHRQLRKYLWISIGLLAMTVAAVVVTISFRMVPLLLKDPSKGNALHPGLVQSLSRGLSLTSSLSATVVVAITAWQHRQIVRRGSKHEETTTQSGLVLNAVTNIGLLYCFSTLVALVFTFIPLPHGTLGDLYYPLSVHIASAYLPTVILLVDGERPWSSSETNTFSDTVIYGRSSPNPTMYPVQFGSADASPTTTVGGITVTGPDIIHPLRKTLSAMSRMSTPKQSRFSDTSLDPRRNL
ncbi:hypothetical protein DFH08DRAFT_207968 [Mycena albidolilacea]|uniref:Uncharacterized protein n=1 Tax=Mycena albidolilacea TaxID=1033008 RepID=A0AAD7A0A7_9AGAR|nr:hypothetical protein DFH08DRAFT_207968 [Mycena albidolilacea]